MEVRTTHIPHHLQTRDSGSRWCGGTEPPTEVIHNPVTDELTVEILPVGSNNHVGEVIQPSSAVEFHTDKGLVLNQDNVSEFAIKALKSKGTI